MTAKGKCLCGSIQFSISQDLPNLYRCHCSLCRKTSGGSSNTATLVPKDAFAWISGQSLISTYQKESGFRSSFCQHCGSPVPNEIHSKDDMWVPAGLLETTQNLETVVDIYTASAACWYKPDNSNLNLPDGPESYETLKALLRSR